MRPSSLRLGRSAQPARIAHRIRRSAGFAIAVGVLASTVASTIVRRVAAATSGPATTLEEFRLRTRANAGWSADERRLLRSLSLASLEPLPADPSNRVADDPRAASLGEALFFDTGLSSNGRVSCASCHAPEKDFQDGKPFAQGVGVTTRRAMPIAGTAYSPWQFWDGRADSQWAQALGPLESDVEHGGTRTQYAHAISSRYRREYEAIFGPLPRLDGLPRAAGPVADTVARTAWQRIPPARQLDISRVYANIGKAIAAYERKITFTPSRFDRWVESELNGSAQSPASAMTTEEVAGLRLFIGKASCVNCHNGPRFTDDHFHNTAVPLPRVPLPRVPMPRVALPFDSGRAVGVRQAVAGEFSCTSRYSDAKPDDCSELRFAVTEGEELLRAYKTPSLRGVADRAPYMHAGQIDSLSDVIAHYAAAPRAPAGHSELRPLRLSPRERRQLELFLRTLSAPAHAPRTRER